MNTDEIIERCARAAHELNRAYCAFGGDHSQPPWEDAPEWQKESVMRGVFQVLADKNRTPSKSHEGWLAIKERDGWVYGEQKDPDKKTHPCMVPYDELPEAQKLKDTLFVTTVRQCYAAICNQKEYSNRFECKLSHRCINSDGAYLVFHSNETKRVLAFSVPEEAVSESSFDSKYVANVDVIQWNKE